MGRNQTWWFFMAAIACGRNIVTITNQGWSSRAKERNLRGVWCQEIEAVRAVLVERERPRVGRDKANGFRCQFRSGFGTTSQDVVTVFSVQSGFRRECGDGRDECIWVSKRDGFYQRRVVRDEGSRKEFVDVLKSKWVWKW
ncbi:BnaCnng53330D [Brassica napus]|uniref:BnaCnng53330D protein n=1 Tax=Brassica napus TaxID=3708 RepID=A0A078JNT7_BRANA|nr:BnaCnng53330D [Brassica napus]